MISVNSGIGVGVGVGEGVGDGVAVGVCVGLGRPLGDADGVSVAEIPLLSVIPLSPPLEQATSSPRQATVNMIHNIVFFILSIISLNLDK